jgi:hypothetical protein
MKSLRIDDGKMHGGLKIQTQGESLPIVSNLSGMKATDKRKKKKGKNEHRRGPPPLNCNFAIASSGLWVCRK